MSSKVEAMRAAATLFLFGALLRSGAALAGDDSLQRAVFVDHRLWMLSDAGKLFSVGERGKDVREERLERPALDVCVAGGRLAVVACATEDCTEWSFRVRDGARWPESTAVKVENDELVLHG